MLISIFNEKVAKWEIKEFSDMQENVSRETPNYPRPNYPRPNYPRPNYPRPNYPRPNYPRPNYPRPNYPEPENKGAYLKAANIPCETDIPHLFSKGFLEAAITIPLYRISLDLLRSGSGPYAVIEWLTEYAHEQDELLDIRNRKNTQY